MGLTHDADYQSKERSVTQQDVADRAGVSRAVVSYVINNGPRTVSEETRRRVLEAIEELGYRPNRYAQGLKLRGTKQARGQIGIVVGGTYEMLKRPYYSAILASIYEEARQQKQKIQFVTFFNELSDPVFFNKHIHPEEISGLILFAPYSTPHMPGIQEIIERIIQSLDNIVCLENVIEGLPVVIFDRAAAARAAVQHLIDLGHRRIAYAGGVDERLDGYRQALLENGLSYDPALVRHPGQKNTPKEGTQAARELIALEHPPTGIFAVSDEVAIGVLALLHDAGIRVPEDIALVSIDDTDIARYVRPALTTVHVPKESMGIHALRTLYAYAAYPGVQPASIVLPTELIVRESCGARKTSSR